MPDLHKLALLLVVFGVGCSDSTPPEPRKWIQVDETGTEAAAATGAGVAARDYTPRISLDRPFLFFIRDTLTGAIVFAGRVSDPSVMGP